MEVWKPVLNYEEKYTISNTGKIKSKRRQGGKGGYVAESLTAKGYVKVHLHKNGGGSPYRVDELVLYTFKPEYTGMRVIHKDGNKLNNNLDNLDVTTETEYRECCNNCFYRAITDSNTFYCIQKKVDFETEKDILFSVCDEHRYECPEDPRVYVYKKNINEKMRVIA